MVRVVVFECSELDFRSWQRWKVLVHLEHMGHGPRDVQNDKIDLPYRMVTVDV